MLTFDIRVVYNKSRQALQAKKIIYGGSIMRKKLLILWAMIFAVVIAGTSAVVYADSVETEVINSYSLRENNRLTSYYNRIFEFVKNSSNEDNLVKPYASISYSRQKLKYTADSTVFSGINLGDNTMYTSAYISNRTGTHAEFREDNILGQNEYGYFVSARAKLDYFSLSPKQTSHIGNVSYDGKQLMLLIINYDTDN